MTPESRPWYHPGRPRNVMIIAALLLLLLYWWHSHDAHKDDKQKAPQGTRVNTAKASRTDVPLYTQGLGNVQAFYTVTITPRVDGQLEQVLFTEGQAVKKGDLLARIDPRPFRAALEQAQATRDKDQATLDNARLDLQRYQTLAPQDLASKQQVDTQAALVAQTTAQIKNDEAAIDNARTQLDYTSITSPIDGRTGIRLVDPGNIVHAADTTGIVVVTQLQPISVIFTLPEDSLEAINAALGRGQVALSALSRDNSTELDRGTVSLIDNQIDATTGTVKVKAVFPNAHNTLWPGQFVNAKVLLQTDQSALTIPSAALQRGPDGVFTYVVRADSTVEVRKLKLGQESGDLVEVSDGLKEGETVVVSNQYRLQADAKVRTGADAAADKAPGGDAKGSSSGGDKAAAAGGGGS
jgi:multidrug efflux system membrane fusion protein